MFLISVEVGNPGGTSIYRFRSLGWEEGVGGQGFESEKYDRNNLPRFTWIPQCLLLFIEKVKMNSSHTHKTRFLYLVSVSFKPFDDGTPQLWLLLACVSQRTVLSKCVIF